MQPENEELARLLLGCNARRLNHELLDIEADASGFHNLVHRVRPPILTRAATIRVLDRRAAGQFDARVVASQYTK
jgi:hypothetical protein